MTIYIINLALIIILGDIICLNKKNGKKIFIILSCLQLILLVGLRSETVGRDTYGYIHFYYQHVINTPLNFGFFQEFSKERGYYLLTKLISLISTEYPLLLTITAAIPLVLMGIIVYRYSKDVVLSMATFVGLRSYAFLFTGTRQSIALGICFYSYRFIVEKRFIPFALCVLLAISFHLSAIAFLPAYFFSRIRLDAKNLTFLAGFAFLIYFLRNFLFLRVSSVLGYHYMMDTAYGGGISTIIVYSLILFFGLLHRKKILIKDSTAELTFTYIFLSIILYIIGYNISVINRIAIYFGWFIILLLPHIVNIFKLGIDRMLVKYLLYIIIFLQFLYFGPGFSLVPYKFFWQ